MFVSTGVQEKLGILSGGVVYAVFDYAAQQPDELSFKAGQQLTVLRKGDESEREWWWSRLGDKEGYVPRNLLGVRGQYRCPKGIRQEKEVSFEKMIADYSSRKL